MSRGRHSSEETDSFNRDLAMMVAGIVLVGAAVFLILFLLAGNDDPMAAETTLSASTSTSAVATSDRSTTTTTTPGSTTTSAATATTTVPVRPPQEVRVVVLNSIGLAGAAGRLTQQLADGGYQTQQADDLEPAQDASRVWYREGFAAEANALQGFLPGALVEPLPDPALETGADVVLVLGTGYTE